VIHRLEWWQLCLPLVIGASLLRPKSAGLLALAGLVPALLGAAAFTLAPVGSSSYVSANIGLMIAGGTLPLLAATRPLRARPPESRRALPGALLMLAGTAAIAIRAGPIVAAIGLPPVLAWAAGVVAAWWTLMLGGRVAREPAAAMGHVPRVPRAGTALLLIGGALVLAGPHVGLVIGGMMLASVGAERTFRQGACRIPVLPLVTLLALGSAYWLLRTVAGPIGLGVGTLDQVPLSSAAARLLALPFGLVAWAWMGLWPLHGVVRPVLLAPLGAALWLRVAAPAVAEGLAHWQPLFVALAVAGLWHAAAAGRLASVLVALAFAALASLGPQSSAAAALLIAAAFTLELPRPEAGAALVTVEVLRRLGFAASAVGAMLAFTAGLRAEVVLTVLAAAGLACGYRTTSAVIARQITGFTGRGEEMGATNTPKA